MKFTRKDKRSDAEKAVDAFLDDELCNANSLDEISTILSLMEKRNALREKKGVDPNTKAVVLGNLLGILLILGYEKGNVITTKALGFIIRGRV